MFDKYVRLHAGVLGGAILILAAVSIVLSLSAIPWPAGFAVLMAGALMIVGGMNLTLIGYGLKVTNDDPDILNNRKQNILVFFGYSAGSLCSILLEDYGIYILIFGVSALLFWLIFGKSVKIGK